MTRASGLTLHISPLLPPRLPSVLHSFCAGPLDGWKNRRQKEGGEGDVSDMIAIKMGDAKESALQTAVSP